MTSRELGDISAAPAVTGSTLTALRAHWRPATFAAALFLGIVGRVSYGWNAPLWFDETFSGVIATQPDFRSLLDWCLSELTGPAFYMPLWAWEKIAGSGNAALRLPSLFCAIAAPLLIYWKGHPERDVRLFWATLALLWLPAMTVAVEARPYPQLFLLGAAHAIAFLRLLTAPDRSRALIWSAITALMVLTNYHALVIGGIQGMIYLARHPRAALRHWPAAAPLLIAGGWMAAHFSFMLAFARTHGAAYAGLPLSDLIIFPALLFGVPLHGTIILGTIAASCVLAARAHGLGISRMTPDRLMALSGIAALALVFGLAFVRPGFAPRYLTPCMPAVLFSIALWARGQLARDAKPVIIVLATMFLMAGGLIRSNLVDPDSDGRHRFNLEQPSAWLAERSPTRLVYFWDGPVGAVSGSDRLGQVAGFFFRRAGHPVDVVVVRTARGDDPNQAVMKAAGDDPASAILWMSNDALAPDRLPRLALLDKTRECRDFGGGLVVVTACRSRP